MMHSARAISVHAAAGYRDSVVCKIRVVPVRPMRIASSAIGVSMMGETFLAPLPASILPVGTGRSKLPKSATTGIKRTMIPARISARIQAVATVLSKRESSVMTGIPWTVIPAQLPVRTLHAVMAFSSLESSVMTATHSGMTGVVRNVCGNSVAIFLYRGPRGKSVTMGAFVPGEQWMVCQSGTKMVCARALKVGENLVQFLVTDVLKNAFKNSAAMVSSRRKEQMVAGVRTMMKLVTTGASAKILRELLVERMTIVRFLRDSAASSPVREILPESVLPIMIASCPMRACTMPLSISLVHLPVV